MPARNSRSNARPLRGREPRHLLGREHARHLAVRRVVRVRVRQRLATAREPVAHHLHLVLLGNLDAQREPAEVLVGGPCRHERHHLDRLGVMANHALHEAHVGGAMSHAGRVGRLGRRDFPARLARRAGLDDARGLGSDWARSGHRQQRECGKASETHEPMVS